MPFMSALATLAILSFNAAVHPFSSSIPLWADGYAPAQSRRPDSFIYWSCAYLLRPAPDAMNVGQANAERRGQLRRFKKRQAAS
jgi:hypothetical protein